MVHLLYTVDGQTSTSSSNATVYISVKSGVAGSFSTTGGTGSELRVPFGAGAARATNLSDGYLTFTGEPSTRGLLSGDVMLKLATGKWVYVGNTSGGDTINVSYTVAGASGSSTSGGAMMFGYRETGFASDTILGNANRTAIWDVVGTGRANLTGASVGYVSRVKTTLT